jgi:1,4-alpha-glucan branching enzyme
MATEPRITATPGGTPDPTPASADVPVAPPAPEARPQAPQTPAPQAPARQAQTPRGPAPVDRGVLEAVAVGAHHEPHAVLGAHARDGAVTIRSLRPFAHSVEVLLAGGERHPLTHEWDGVWAGVLDRADVPDYRLVVSYEQGVETVLDEPYRYLPTLGDVDLHLIGEGRHEQLWEVLGAHVRRYPGERGDVTGTSFAVWAPNARAVGWSGTSTTGWAACTRCAASAGPASGSCSCPTSARARGTSSRSSGATGGGGRRPTRWRSAPRCRPPPPASWSRARTPGRTPPGWPTGPPATCTTAR